MLKRLVVFVWLVAAVLGVGWAGEPDLVVVHVNDTHGRLMAAPNPRGLVGGAARLATRISEIREEWPDRFLLLHAGDVFSKGDAITVHSGGEVNIRVMNYIGYDAFTPGNGEFYWGLENLLARQKEADFPMIHGNVRYKEGEKAVFEPYVVKEVGGVKVGILGLGAVYMDHPFATMLDLEDPVASAERLVPQVEGKAELVVLLSHLGDEWDRRIAAEVGGIDVIVGGHTHGLMEKPERLAGPGEGDEVVFVRSGCYGEWMGRLDLYLERDGGEVRVKEAEGKLLPMDESVKEDPKVLEMLTPYEKALSEVVGEAADHLRNPGGRPSPAGTLVAEAIRVGAGADMALLDRGAVCAGFKKGKITLTDVYGVHPWRNGVLLMKLTGAEVAKILEAEDLLYAGPGVKSITAPPEEVNLKRGGVKMKKVYTVAVGDYGRGTTASLRDVAAEPSGHRVDELLIGYLRAREAVPE